ncbi:MAG: hypothetical protein KF866_05140 [Phycisphaeraceae bacterium]|nr:hypothetical protein [Phycisphaeraceae bacterium]
MRIASAVRLTGLGLAAGAAAGLALIITDKVVGWQLGWPVALGVTLGAGAALGALASLFRRQTLINAARHIDTSHQLKDQLSSAMAIAPRADTDPFAAWTVLQAEEAAANVRIARAAPVMWPRTWIAWPITSLAAVSISLFVPWVSWQKGEQAPATAAQIAAAEQAQRILQEVTSLVRQSEQPSPLADLVTPEQARALEELESQLARRAIDGDEAEARAARIADALAEKAHRRADAWEREIDTLRDTLATRIQDNESEPSTPEIGDFIKALQSGDFAAAEQAAERLEEALQHLPEEDRSRIAERLEDLARQLADTSETSTEPVSETSTSTPPDSEGGLDQTDTTPPESGGAARQTPTAADDLERRGIPRDKAEQLAQNADPEEIAQALEEHGVSPDTAQRVADRIADQLQQERARQAADEQRRQLQDALKRAADDARKRPETPSDPERTPDPASEGKPLEQPDEQPGQKPGDQPGQQPGEQPGQKPGDQPGQQPGEQPGQKPGDQPGQQPGEQPGQKPGDQPGQQPGEQPGQKPGDQPGQQPGEQPGQIPGDQPGQQPGEQPGQKPGDQPGQQPGEQPGQKPGDQPGQQPGEQPGQKPGDQPGEQPGAQPGQHLEERRIPAGGSMDDTSPVSEGEGAQPVTTDGQGEASDGTQSVHQDDAARPEGAPGEGRGDTPPPASLRETIRRMREREQATRDLREDARRLQEQITRPTGETPDGSPTGPRLPPREVREPSPRTPTDVVDVRPPSDEGVRERVLAEWYDDAPIVDGASRAPGIAQGVQEAARGAERAIEQQMVPGRFNTLLRRVYRRLEADAPQSGGE